MNPQAQRNPTVSNGNQSQDGQPTIVQAKVNWLPMIVTTIVTTGFAVFTTIYLTRQFEKKKEERELEKEREREEQAMANPAMPMMWPGMSSSQTSAHQDTSQLEALADRLQAMERGLEQREQVLGQREHHLRLITGVGEE